MEKSVILEELKKILAYKLDANIDMKDIGVDEPLYEGGIGLDSISIVNLIGQIEQHFDFQFEDKEISVEIFASLNTLSDFVERKQAARALKSY